MEPITECHVKAYHALVLMFDLIALSNRCNCVCVCSMEIADSLKLILVGVLLTAVELGMC